MSSRSSNSHPQADFIQLLHQQGFAAQVSVRQQQLHIGLDVAQHPKPQQVIARIYTLLEQLDLEACGLETVEKVFVYGLRAPRQADWTKSFAMPTPGFTPDDTDLSSFNNRISNAILFPVLMVLAMAMNAMSIVKFLLRGISIWFHEFGHAIVAWLSGRKAIPLPLGWTPVEPERSPLVYGCVLALLGLLFWAGRKEGKRWPMVLAVALAVIQFSMTWLMSADTFDMLLYFGGIGGEFLLCTLLMVGFYFPLPDYFRWDLYRYPVVLGAAFTFWGSFWSWRQIDKGVASIPWGSMWGGPEHTGGDMNQLSLSHGWSNAQIIGTYNTLGSWCVLALLGIYGYFLLKQNHTVFFGWWQRLIAQTSGRS